ncbi:hypothetical protein [Miltoncostaea marina]|uniref:hypothetical protein n=1 Tax=Miltoncostaea marina TaxID=2843215 RepID=UPI001C3D64EB|nr:hypothetical protein [Miltoncostaea marina]
MLGATGDLTGRYLLPALAALAAAGRLPEGMRVVGAGRRDMGDAAFRDAAARDLDEHAADVPRAARRRVLDALGYRPFDARDPASVAAAVEGEGPVAAYIALPPALAAPAVGALAAAGLPRGSRIAVEKPFGEDLEGARELNRLLAGAARELGEHAAFRVDHFLGLAPVANILGLRLANPPLEAAWRGAHIAAIEIVWEETLGLEGRAAYYDRAGQLRDMVQNHLMQVLCLLAMEPPADLGQQALRDAKVALLRSVRPPQPDAMADRTRRARYDGYAREEGVDPGRGTETFAEVVLALDGARWGGTPVRIRTGKALARDRMEAVVRFAPAAGGPFAGAAGELRIGLGEPAEVGMVLVGATPGPHPEPAPMALAAPVPPSPLPEYARVLLDLLEGRSALSVRGDEAEEAWRIVSPVLDAWAAGAVPLEGYRPGSEGPPPLATGALSPRRRAGRR